MATVFLSIISISLLMMNCSTSESGQTLWQRSSISFQEPVSSMLPEADATDLPPWRGVNLLNRFSLEWSNRPFIEADFTCAASLGFNFARLPLDYRTWTRSLKPARYRSAVLANLDEAIAWGYTHGVHIQLNLHRAPGYCVNPPAEAMDLWSDPRAQAAFVEQWQMMAYRYRSIPSRYLSFNLVNEPAGVDSDTYARVMRMAIAAIRAEDSGRLIVVDGLDYGHTPVWEMAGDGVAMSMHHYQPFGLTHYKASWIEGSSNWLEPQWPVQLLPDKLYGSYKSELAKPFVLHGPFTEGAKLYLGVHTVSSYLELEILADGEIVDSYRLESGPGRGDWEEVVYREEWGIYQNIFKREYHSSIPAGSSQIAIVTASGDWLSFSHLRLEYPDGTHTIIRPTVSDWGHPPTSIWIDDDRGYRVADGAQFNQQRLKKEFLDPWLALRDSGVGIMVGEWGVYNQTPHQVALDWMRDSLELFQDTGLGWALWELRGSFGVLDSGRVDVAYEDSPCGKLDRQMLDLLISEAGEKNK